ncbi:DsbA family protein [Candidatus Roizmanbacteria bacterium]|nr:DsbA family protein [Candidatus Roizmanbacteria bacterium]
MALKNKDIESLQSVTSLLKSIDERLEELNDKFETPLPPPPQKSSNILIFLLIVMSFFSGSLFLKVRGYQSGTPTTQDAQNPTTQGQDQQAAVPERSTELKIAKPSTDEHWRGSQDARYVWVEYSDLECPFCKRIHPDMQKILSENEGKLAWVFRHFPLTFHPKAQKSAEAVECAAEQGGNETFWKMVDAVYEKMPDLELLQLPSLATEVGLNETTFKDCLDGGKQEKKVKDQQAEGTQAGVQATPTGVIYDMQTGKTKLVEGAVPYETLKTELDNFMKEG